MNARLLKLWNDLLSSYWLIPALMAFSAILLSILTIAIDRSLGAEWIDRIPWQYANQPEGARAVLSAIASSTITVAGVIFSITIASVVYASSQYGPRVLGNFMRNRGNQVTLGTFTATFLYCLLVLRTVHSETLLPPGAEPSTASAAFVPHVSILTGILMAVANVGVLIYFIHHIASSIYLPHVVAGIARDALLHVDHLFPARLGYQAPEDREDEPALPEGFLDEAVPVRADGEGYIQAIETDLLLEVAQANDLIVRVEYRPGNFVNSGKIIALVWPRDRVNDHVEHAIRASFAWGKRRTPFQDALFSIDELVEIAARALSPGVNDPFTAMNCLDWLGSIVARRARRETPDTFRHDDEGKLRVVTRALSTKDLADAVFGQLLPYFEKDRNASLHMMQVLAQLADDVTGQVIPTTLLRYARTLNESWQANRGFPFDREEMEQRYRVVARLLQSRSGHRELVEENRWIGGSA